MDMPAKIYIGSMDTIWRTYLEIQLTKQETAQIQNN